ncbi:TPR repeat protein [Pseudomonas sp. TE6288]|uniref:tetratricopeptide repeat protein n=1 Tax=Pseudomonas TaxID=286 RepID=UPI002404B3A5|nr:tetratricopeptide repeat protein [Pseudomonas hunanensis]MDF9755620.1 TPR repeat protein [Pseudomonas hunanensis]
MKTSGRKRLGCCLAVSLMLLSMPALSSDHMNTHTALPPAIAMKLAAPPEPQTTTYPRDSEEFEHLIELAKNGNAHANYVLGLIYSDQRLPDTERNYKASVAYYEKAINLYSRHAPALARLAFLYRAGLGTPVDIKKAVALYERAGESGSAVAYNNLSTLYAVGDVVPQDFKKARMYAEYAAHLGHAESFEILQHWDYYVEISSTTDSKKISEIVEKYKNLELQKKDAGK